MLESENKFNIIIPNFLKNSLKINEKQSFEKTQISPTLYLFIINHSIRKVNFQFQSLQGDLLNNSIKLAGILF